MAKLLLHAGHHQGRICCSGRRSVGAAGQRSTPARSGCQWLGAKPATRSSASRTAAVLACENGTTVAVGTSFRSFIHPFIAPGGRAAAARSTSDTSCASRAVAWRKPRENYFAQNTEGFAYLWLTGGKVGVLPSGH